MFDVTLSAKHRVKSSWVWKTMRRISSGRTQALVQGMDNQSQLLNHRFEKIVQGMDNQSQLLDSKLTQLIEGIKNQSALLNNKLETLIRTQTHGQPPPHSSGEPHSEGLEGVERPRAAQLKNGGATASVVAHAAPAPRRSGPAGDLREYADIFAGIGPWSGNVPKGYVVDFLGTLTPAEFRAMWGVDPQTAGGNHQATALPTIADGEGWFEAVNWVVAAQEARERYVMVTLGACYGAQAVGSYRALQSLNPMPCKLVAVEADPGNVAWTIRHFRDNGIDPDRQWIVEAAMSDTNAPVFFPVGSPGTGAQNCFSTNEQNARAAYVKELIGRGADEALRNLLLHNTTGITKSLVPGHDFRAEIKLLSAVTLKDVLGPFDFVDYLEADIQQSEITVFPPYMGLLKRKVRRIHIGTHGRDVHQSLHGLFAKDGWEIVFNYEPNAEHVSALGAFKTNDGILTVRNPSL